MRTIRLLLFLLVAVLFSSCATIRFGKSTTVRINSDHPGDTVNILAIGPKGPVSIENVTLPYGFKAKHNNLPLRVEVSSENYIYSPFSIDAIHKGDNMAFATKLFGYPYAIGGAVATGFAWYCGLPAVGLGGVLLTIGYTAETDIPNSKYYFTYGEPVNSENAYLLGASAKRENAIKDVYKLLARGDYKLSRAKADYLMNHNPTAELYYLRGMSSYYLGKHKSALQDLNSSLHLLASSPNPQLTAEVQSCIKSIQQSIAIKKEQRAQMWGQIATGVLTVAAQTYAKSQSGSSARHTPSMSMPMSAQVADKQSVRRSLDQLAMQSINQVQAQEMQNFEAFRSGTKKPDGSDYSYAEYMALMGAGIEYAKQDGYDIIEESRNQIRENRAEADKAQKEEKERLVKRMSAPLSLVDQPIASQPSKKEEKASEKQDNPSETTPAKQESNTNNSSSDPKPDARQENKSQPVSSSDYKKIKSVDIYHRNGDKYRKVFSADLYKKNEVLYIKINDTFHNVYYSNWQKFRKQILFGSEPYYFND